jgi:hypothetical protein
MKRILFCILIVHAGLMNGQVPAITMNNLPTAGDTNIQIIIDSTQANSIVISPPGANQTWTFPSLIKQDSDVVAIINPTASPYFSDFPSSNLVYKHLSYTPILYDYVNYQSNNNYILGQESSTTKDVFYPSYQGFTMPFTYLNNYSVTGHFIQTSNGSITVLHATLYDTIIADAYGTISVQGHTYNNAIRLRVNETLIDSVFSGPTFIAAYTGSGISYEWYAQNYKDAVFRVDLGIAAPNGIRQVSYLKTPKLINGMGIANFNNEDFFRVYPNPTTSLFSVETNSQEKQTIDLYDINARHILSKNINGTTEIDVSNLDNGIYNLTIKSNTSVTYKKLIVAR